MELKIYIRQPKIYDKSGLQEQHIGGVPPKLVITPGPIPMGRRLPDYGKFIDVTAYTDSLYELKLTWTMDRNADGLPSVGASNQRKAASGTLRFEGEAYKYLRQWLVDDVSAVVNTIEVKIVHVNCGNYLEWVIKASDITWCDRDVCSFDVGLKQKDEALTCIKNTMITDDWQGWFGNTTRPWSNKRHPRFSYCNEIRPNGILITLWWTITQLMSVLGPFMLVIAPIVNSIVFTLKYIIYPIINTILGILGKKKLDGDKLQFLQYSDIKDIFGNFFIESAGCGREHPAPLIRDYILNVCAKCQVRVDEHTAPIFFSQSIFLEKSGDDNGAQWHYNPYYNACYFNGVVDKGIRRFDELNIFSGAVKNTTDWWLPGNGPLLTLDTFLDQLKGVFNHDWRVENNTLYFMRKDYWLNDTPAFDFTDYGADKGSLLSGICYEWDEGKSAVYAKGIYSNDPADVCGNNACNQMNGYASFGSIDVNPLLDGVMDKTVAFGATKFRLDGASTDYLYDAMQQVINTTLITGSVWTGSLFKTVNGFIETYANYALLLKQETTALPKILIWDGYSMENAKCVRPYHASVIVGGPTPVPNNKYNQNSRLWQHVHEPQTKVSGRKLVPPVQPTGLYEVLGLFATMVARNPAQLVNYPMYFEPGYKDNLWDWFHWIDDINESPKRHLRFSAKMDLCCDTLQHKIKPFEDAASIVLGQKVKLPLAYINEGRITEIEISYDMTNDTGPYIQLKGIV